MGQQLLGKDYASILVDALNQRMHLSDNEKSKLVDYLEIVNVDHPITTLPFFDQFKVQKDSSDILNMIELRRIVNVVDIPVIKPSLGRKIREGIVNLFGAYSSNTMLKKALGNPNLVNIMKISPIPFVMTAKHTSYYYDYGESDAVVGPMIIIPGIDYSQSQVIQEWENSQAQTYNHRRCFSNKPERVHNFQSTI